MIKYKYKVRCMKCKQLSETNEKGKCPNCKNTQSMFLSYFDNKEVKK